MATGIEAASLVLALLPLLVNQIDNYIQGFQRMTCFKPKNYWREMESYRSILETERAILLNTLLIAVDGVTHYEYGDWTRDPGSAFWTSQDVWQKLRQKLRSSYEPFTSTINVLSGLLKRLSQELGLSVDSTGRIDVSRASNLPSEGFQAADQVHVPTRQPGPAPSKNSSRKSAVSSYIPFTRI